MTKEQMGGDYPPDWFWEQCPKHHEPQPCESCAAEWDEAYAWYKQKQLNKTEDDDESR